MEVNRSSLKSRGFTLIEILITVAVAAILLGVAVPSLQKFTANNQVTSAANSIVAGLNLARSTAVTLGEEVAICGSADENACSLVDFKNKELYNRVWRVFDNADTIRLGTLDRGLSVTLSGDEPSNNSDPLVEFGPDGTTTDLTSDLKIKICGNLDVTTDCSEITVTRFGVISSTKTPATG